MTPNRLVFATRRSLLALAQSRAFAARLGAAHAHLDVQELHVVTTGDRIQDRPLKDIGGKGLFVKEIEKALLDGQADFAVHSIKDVPGQPAPGLRLACIPAREDPRDAFFSRSGQRLEDVAPNTRVGTSSLRRQVMVARARPDLAFAPLRGNVDTRMRKVREGVVDATVLACAGLRRLDKLDEATQLLEPEVSLPAVGQGALGIECREDDTRTLELVSALHDAETATAVAAERGVMIAAEGSCQVPIAAFAKRTGGDALWLRAMLAKPDAAGAVFVEDTIPWPSTEQQAEELSKELGIRLRERVFG
ncbi:MAG: hydroxymethylbilane synthase [Myxococcota bacterium]